ncbi:hypothetical protein [Catenulispora subtropica]|uniref:hypothetical protein n=1 Tax=Catenulispora subtropica TaxID=450798 RepID=UPI0031E4947F
MPPDAVASTSSPKTVLCRNFTSVSRFQPLTFGAAQRHTWVSGVQAAARGWIRMLLNPGVWSHTAVR